MFFTLIVRIVIFHIILVNHFTECSKILIIHPHFTGSHILTLKSLAESLVDKGHSVHVVKWLQNKDSSYENDYSSPQNLTVTTLTMDNSDGRFTVLTNEKEAAFMLPTELVWAMGGRSSLEMLFTPGLKDLFPFLSSVCETLILNDQLTKQLKTNGFDLVIVDYIWNECSIIYARDVLKIPVVVGFWGISPETLVETSTRTNFLATLHVPNSPFAIRGPDEEQPTGLDTLKERIFQCGQTLLAQAAMWFYFSYITEVTQRLIPGACSPFEAQQDLDGVLVNYDSTIDISPKAIPTNHLQMGGIQILTKEKLDSTVLPQNILDWMNPEESTGIIFFSIGLTLASDKMPEHVIKSFLEAFSKFPQFRILFQLEGNSYNITVPPNVKITGWISQQKILAHPNTKLFVNHCGLQGVTESVYYGVPIVCMPITNDAFITHAKITAHGIGLGVSLNQLSTDEITSAIQRVIFTSSYARNVKRLSSLMRDKNETPMVKTIDFLEHLIRKSRLDPVGHQQFQQRRLSFFEYFYLDVLFVLIMTGIVYAYMSLLILKRIFACRPVRCEIQ